MLVLILFLVACGSKEIESNMSQKVPEFDFTTQENEKLGLKDLKGEWWIADFIFTKCTTVCLPMTANMSKLQDQLKNEGLDVQIISFTVDPANDSPGVLKKYAQVYDADFSMWSFLTGYEFEEIKEFSENAFYSEVSRARDSDQINHGVRFYLVNPDGEIIKYYDGIDMDEVKTIIDDLKKVL